MCGIVGIVRRDGRAVEERRLVIMRDTMAHRGPDDKGVYISPKGGDVSVGLGHRRLSIIDLSSAGHQPMAIEDGRLVIVYNGEIYNFDQIRHELQSRGHAFFSHSDTEVILRGFSEWGDGIVERLVGMFAFAIWDEKNRCLFAARDPFGIKPLHYYQDGRVFIFSSEIKAILASGMVTQEIDEEALCLYLSLGYIPAPTGIYQGIKKLPPGHLLRVDASGIKVSRYYDLAARIENKVTPDYDGARRELREQIESSVARELVSDVPLGAFLSGGLDSSIITGVMNRLGGDIKTFTIGFGGDGIFDETDYARAVVEKNERVTGTIHDLKSTDLLDLIPTVMDSLDEPFADFSVVPTFLVAQKTREKVTVALSGDGADEVFGGYWKYLGEELYRWWALMPGFFRNAFIAPLVLALPQSKGSRLGDAARKAQRFIEGDAATANERHYRWLSVLSREEGERLLGDRVQGRFRQRDAQTLVEGLFGAFDGDTKNRMLWTDLNLVLPGDMLTKVDLMSMKNSLEVRVPFLEPSIVELAFTMPGAYKLLGTRKKRILEDAFVDLLPKKVIGRPKKGFEMPVGEWLKGELAPLFFDVVTPRAVKSLGVFRYGRIQEIYRMHRQNERDFTFLLWNIFAVQWWEESRKRRALS
jgi:asparagine synthase (glutamine-hydrolysing)